MANLYSKATGNWTTLGTFNTLANGTGTDTVPLNTHDVVIQSGHNVTLDNTTCVCKSLTVNVGGTLTAKTTANNTLTAENDIVTDGTCTLDMSSDVTKVCTIITNNANGSGSGTISAAGSAAPAHNAGGMMLARYTATITWKGFTRNRWTTTTTSITAGGSTSFTVSDATGWQVGDRLILATTSAYNASPLVDLITIDSIAGNTITGFTRYLGALHTCVNAHASGCYVGNFTSNVVIGPKTAGWSGNVAFGAGGQAAATASKTVNHVQFEALKTCSYFGLVTMAMPFVIAPADFTDTGWVSFDSNCFYDFRQGNYGLMITGGVSDMTRSNNVHYHPNMSSPVGNDQIPTGVINATQYTYGCNFGTETDVVIFGAVGCGIAPNSSKGSIVRPKISGMETGIFLHKALNAIDVTDPDIQSCNNSFRTYYGTLNITSSSSTASKIGTITANTNVFKLGPNGSSACSLTDCNFQAGGTFISNGSTTPLSSNLITLVNGAATTNSAVTSQEIYRPYGTIKRNNATTKRSTSSVAIAPTTTGIDTQYTVSIPCTAGASITVVGSCQLSGLLSAWTTVSAVISGLSASGTLTYNATTAAQSGAWEDYTLTATNNSGADGNFTLTFTGKSASGTPTAYFDGIPTASPFVTKARHYGYQFDQTLPNAVVNSSVSVSEATALGYAADFTITGGTTQSNIALVNSSTFQKSYDYSQAWACTTANLGYAVPCSAPVAGVLIAASNWTVPTTKTLNGSGSLAMGTFTLTVTDTPFAYTYTGGTFSQATTVPSFSGGTVAIGAAGTFTFTMSSGKVTATPTSASNYVLSNGTFTGSNLFWNTTAYNITVEIPAGATFSSAGSPGAGTVTFVAPVEYQSVTVTGFTPGSRIYIKDVTSGTVLCNSTTSTTNVVISGSSCVWTDPSAASATRQIALRIAYVSGATAKVFIDKTNIGTCAVSGGGKDVSYIASQSADTTYNSNAVDGSTVTGITFTDAATDLVVCNLAGGSTTWPRIYAAFVYWLSTALGIDDDVTYISAPDTANYLLTAMKIRNANATPLTITSGYGRSATTGLVEDIIDVAGSTGNIYPEPNHVVPYQTTGTYAITGDISTVLTSIGTVPAAVLAAAAVDPIASDVEKVLGTAIQTGSTSTASIGY